MATGVLLVGGASRRFGSAKALASLSGEILAERTWRVLGEAFPERLAVGKQADGLPLPFPLLDDGAEERHPAAGIVAALRHAPDAVCVVLPVDCPAIGAAALRSLAEACADAAVPADGDPLPGAYRSTAIPALERCLAARKPLASVLEELEVRTVEVDHWQLANVNTRADLEALERRERAVAVAVEVAVAHGIEAPEARVLQDWNDTVVHLAPHRIVARVGTSWLRADKEATYARELEVAAHAASRGGPCVAPSALLPPGPHRREGLVLAFWEYLQHGPDEPAPAEVAQALRAFHAAVADFPGPLPRLEERHERASIVAAELLRPEARDRDLLATTLSRLRAAFAEHTGRERVLHGGPHSSNVLATREGLRWIDFDTVCTGPLEWDVAHLPEEAADHFPETDRSALELARSLVGVEVAIWCWHSYGRAPEVDAAARFHLDRVRALKI